MNINELKKALAENKGLDAAQVESVSAKIEALSPDIRAALEKWAESDVIESPVYSGYDVSSIMKAKPFMNVLGAYLALDWLRRDPENARKSIERSVHIIRDKRIPE